METELDKFIDQFQSVKESPHGLFDMLRPNNMHKIDTVAFDSIALRKARKTSIENAKDFRDLVIPLIIWSIVFEGNKVSVFNRAGGAKPEEIVKLIDNMLGLIPKPFKPKIICRTRNYIETDNGYRLYVFNRVSSMRGMGVDSLYIEGFKKITLEEWAMIWPTISSRPKATIVTDALIRNIVGCQ